MHIHSIGFALSMAISLAACTSPPAPSPPVTDAEVHAQAAGAIVEAKASNAISGTLEVPLDLKAVAVASGGQPPAVIHVFRTTGELIREAHVSLYWKDDRSLAFVIDNVPGSYPVVLAATVEPGVVLRSITAAALPNRPASRQTISPRTEIMVQEMIDLGLMPNVAPGGIGSVIAQGGLDPAGAAELNSKAALELEAATQTEAGKSIEQIRLQAAALRKLADSQRSPAAQGAGCAGLHCVEREVRNGWAALDAKLKAIVVPADVQQRLDSALQLHMAALQTDIPRPAQLRLPDDAISPATPQYRVQFWDDIARTVMSRIFIALLYEEGKRLANESLGKPGPNGKPFTEAEIADALENGRGPYRESCSQVSFDPNAQSCKVVLNPLDQAREVLITRKTVDFENQLKALEEASKRDDIVAVARMVKEMPSVFHFVLDDERWQSPVGLWRLKLLQDEGGQLSGSGSFIVFSDAEARIDAPGRTPGSPVQSGLIQGVLSIWGYENDTSQSLDNFSIRFNWDSQDKGLTDGVIKGERRTDGAGNRVSYNALFEATMTESNRIKGIWKDEAEDMFGRFEMIRGTARFSLTEAYR